MSSTESDTDGAGTSEGLQRAGSGSVGPARRRPGRQPRTTIPCQVPGCGTELIHGKAYFKR